MEEAPRDYCSLLADQLPQGRRNRNIPERNERNEPQVLTLGELTARFLALEKEYKAEKKKNEVFRNEFQLTHLQKSFKVSMDILFSKKG
jgi:hypothetical protein